MQTIIAMWQTSSLPLVVLDLCGSIAVTVHVLLNKRNVTSAIGWIGLAWFSPFIGTIIYFTFGINRVKRKAMRMMRSRQRRRSWSRNAARVNDPLALLKSTTSALAAQNLTTAKISAPLLNGDEAYPLMIAAINAAEKTIALSSYIFRGDSIGSAFVGALSDAHRRGVSVRVLIDGFGGGLLMAPAYQQIQNQGVPAALFMSSWLPWKMQFINLRLHKKILVVDGQTAFSGGLNISDENVKTLGNETSVRDTHFKIEGSLVRQIALDFVADWFFATGETLNEELWAPTPEFAGLAQARVITSGPDQDVEQLYLVILSALSAAQSSIKIATPYFLPDDGLVTALQLAAMRGVKVIIVIPEKSDHAVMDWAMAAHVGPLITAGCSLWRSPSPFDHSKLMTVDNSWCLFGSPNWDTRSFRLNFELAIESHDADLAKQIADLIDQNCINPITFDDLNGRNVLIKIRDATVRLAMPYL